MNLKKVSIDRRIEPKKVGAPPLPGGPRNRRREVRLYERLDDALSSAAAGKLSDSANQVVIEALEEKLGVVPEEVEDAPRKILPIIVGLPQVDEEGQLDLSHTHRFDLGGFTPLIEATKDDFLVPVGSQYHIATQLGGKLHYGSIALAQPSSEIDGEAALVRVTFNSGSQQWVIKAFSPTGLDNDRVIELQDFNGNTILMSSGNVAKAEPFALIKKVLDFSSV